MAVKILLLVACAIAVWMFTRPRLRQRAKETPLVRCTYCGVYHPRDDSCSCKKS